MKRFAILAGLCGAVSLSAPAATTPLFITAFPITAPPEVAPQIDATAWVNASSFFYSNPSINSIPFQTLNTLFFTNRSSGILFAEPGFRFDYFKGNVRAPMDTWVNSGSVSANNLGSLLLLTSTTAINASQPGSWLLVSATNIVSPGSLSGGEMSLVQLNGQNLDLNRTAIRVAPSDTNLFFFGGGYLGSSNYFNDPGVVDLYWGLGTNNTLDAMGPQLLMPPTGLEPPFPNSPAHQVVEPLFTGGTFFTNNTIVPLFSFQPYQSFVYTNRIDATNIAVQMVLIPTNSFDTNFTSEVRFYPDADGGATAVVGFHLTDFDIITRQLMTNSVFIADALAFETNLFLADNYQAVTRRPSTFEVTRASPFFFGGVATNAIYRSDLLYRPSFVSNIVDSYYAAYSAQVGTLPVTSSFVGTNSLSDPTNYPGRVEIRGDDVDLDNARIRAEQTVIIQAANLLSSNVGQIDAPYVNLDLGTEAPVLTISNVVPQTVRRLSGQLSAYSTIWNNAEISTNAVGGFTNNLRFHVLIVEPTFSADQQVIINELGLRADLIRLEDTLVVGKSFELEGSAADIHGGFSLPLSYNLNAGNLVGLQNWTNSGAISVPGAGIYGADRDTPYQTYINHGTNVAAAQFISTEYFENDGLLSSSSGVIDVDADQMLLTGTGALLVTNVFTNFFFDFFTGTIVTNLNTNITVVGSVLRASGDVELTGNDLVASNSVIFAGGPGRLGALRLSLTNSLTDGGEGTTNLWTVTSGFGLLTRPANGDLFYTYMTSVIDAFGLSDHIWAAEDRGTVPAGFTNNQAVGILTVDGGESSLARFAGVGTNDALYVDYLQLLNYSTNFDNSAYLSVDPNLTIYFAHANVPAEKLDGAANGHIRWVPSFAGPHSSTNLVYPNGSNVVANLSLVLSKDLDSDGDGIPNADDPTPIFVPDDVGLVLEYAGGGGGGGVPGNASISWTALAWSTNYLEYSDSLDSGEWHVLTSFVHGPVTSRVRFEDVISGLKLRVYRVRQVPR